MIVGALGDIVFSVSSRTVKTISNFMWSGSARYATHDLHAGNSISEYTGTDLAKITFDIQLLASLGVDPMSEIWRLFDLERQGVTLPLTIGNHGYGRYRWTILSHKTKAEYVSVKDPGIVSYNIDFTYYVPTDTTLSGSAIQEAVNAAVEEYVAWQSGKLGRDINPDKLRDLLWHTGVKRIVLRSPSYQVLEGGKNNAAPQIAKLGTKTVVNGGYEDE